MDEILNLIYVSNTRLYGMQIPTRVQVKFARDYCKKKELDFSLPVSESWTSNKFELLQNIITKPFKNLILFSDILISSPYVLMVIENNLLNSELNEKAKVHLTFSNEEIQIKELHQKINSILRNQKYALKYSEIRELLKNKKFF